MAEGYTIDAIIWGILARKTHLLGKALDGRADKLEAEIIKGHGSGKGAGAVTGEQELSLFFASGERETRGPRRT
jgi:hypothetical protein